MTRPRLLDLFCGAGGCSAGYHRANFDVVGIDNRPMPRYPFKFIQADALEYLAEHGQEFDAIHASPPCQQYSRTRTIWPGKVHPDLVDTARRLLIETGRPWIIENVPGAPLVHPVMLCGTYFGLKVIRHRFFESSILLLAPSVDCAHPPRGSVGRAGRGVGSGGFICVAGHLLQVSRAREAMGIDWMSRDELSQAIPPAYTYHLGLQLRNALDTPTGNG